MIGRVNLSAFFSACCLVASMRLVAMAQDPGKPDLVTLDSVTAKPGQAVKLTLSILADDTTSFSDKQWQGIGSFCIPLKYDRNAMKVDSVKYVGALVQWDARFTNPKIDTGFVSIAGIYTLAGKDKPVIFNPDHPREAIDIFVNVNKDAKPGTYLFDLTIDPIQKEMYFGSPDGVHGWKPQFSPGKIVIK